MCRGKTNECDVPEYCNGSSQFCQPDVFIQNGYPCQNNRAYCYNGMCQYYDAQCQVIFGSSKICYLYWLLWFYFFVLVFVKNGKQTLLLKLKFSRFLSPIMSPSFLLRRQSWSLIWCVQVQLVIFVFIILSHLSILCILTLYVYIYVHSIVF